MQIVAQILFLIALVFGIAFFVRNIKRMLRNIKLGKTIDRSDHSSERWSKTLRIAFGQSKMVKKPVSGFLHVIVYLGFIIINIEVLEIIIDGLFGTHRILSFMGSLKQMKNMQTASEWDKYHERIDKSYKTIEANKRAKLLLSAKRAAQGARGVVIAQGSTLMEQNSVVANLEDTVFWINKGAEMTVREIDLRLASKLQAAAWNTSTSLLTNLGSAYGVSQMKV